MKKRNQGTEWAQRLLLLSNPICLTHRGREGKDGEREEGREERGRGGRRMRTRPDQAEGGVGGWQGGRCCLEKGREWKKKNQREAGWGVGLRACACVCERGREKAASECVLCMSVCVCARVCARSVPFLSLFDYWVGKKSETEYREIEKRLRKRNTDRGEEEDLKRVTFFKRERERKKKDKGFLFWSVFSFLFFPCSL